MGTKPWMNFHDGKLLLGNTIDVLKEMPSESVDMVITSPPYYQLRSYNTEPVIWDDDRFPPAGGDCDHEWVYTNKESMPLDLPPTGGVRKKFEPSKENRGKQNSIKIKSATCKRCGAWLGELGQEPTPQLFIKHLCDIFDEVKRVLKPHGSCYVNLGDSYSNMTPSLPPKCLVQLPSLFAIEMTYGRGWTLRNRIVWYKPNALPSSVKDRFTNSYEYVYFFTKSEKYYFEQQFEPYESMPHGGQFGSRKGVEDDNEILQNVQYDPDTDPLRFYGNPGRNKRDVWFISTQSSTVPHFAQFPESLIETPILACCPKYLCNKCGKPREKFYVEVSNTGIAELTELTEQKESDARILNTGNGLKKEERWTDCNCGKWVRETEAYEHSPGVVLDPFVGSGTTCKVARKLGRKWIGIDISESFLKEAVGKISGWQRPDGKDVSMSLLEQGFKPPEKTIDEIW